jgi:hypothetical protein
MTEKKDYQLAGSDECRNSSEKRKQGVDRARARRGKKYDDNSRGYTYG